MDRGEKQVKINGQGVELNARIALDVLLSKHGFAPRSVVVEHNSEAIAPSEFSERFVEPGDSLEVVRIVAGG